MQVVSLCQIRAMTNIDVIASHWDNLLIFVIKAEFETVLRMIHDYMIVTDVGTLAFPAMTMHKCDFGQEL